MTEPALAVKVTGKGRMYRRPGTGALYPSITNVIDILDKPAIPRWAAKEVAGAAWDRRKALMEMDDRDEAIDFLKGTPWRKRDKRADVGTVVHSVAEALSRDTALPSFDDEHAPYLDAFMGFVTDFDPKFLTIEATVFSDQHQFAGTADFLAEIGGALVLGDHKTGSGVYSEVALQLAALRFAEWLWDRETGDLTPMPKVDACIAVHLRPGEYKVHTIDAGEAAFDTFIGLRQAWPWAKANDAVGPSVNRARLLQVIAPRLAANVGVAGESQLRVTGLPSSDSSKTGDGLEDSTGGEPADPATPTNGQEVLIDAVSREPFADQAAARAEMEQA